MEATATLKEIRERDQLRRIFSRTASSLETHLKSNQYEKAQVDYQYLKLKVSRLILLDQSIQDKFYASEEYNEEDVIKEIDSADRYMHMWHTIENAMKGIEGRDNKKMMAKPRGYKLPIIEIKKFDDNLKNWLSYWGQFKKIHEDDSIPDEDKFQYLVQSMKEDSDARILVESFPPSAENYNKAIEQLKGRFGREDILIQIYVRELLKLILNPKKESLRLLYDKITSYLLSLESLGIVKHKYETILYPLVESAVPTDILTVWNRSSSNTSHCTELSSLLNFLKNEVESEERVRLSRSGFGGTNSSVDSFSGSGNGNHLVPTAAALVSNSNTKAGNKEVELCCFCTKDHKSLECSKLHNMSLDEKVKIVKQKGNCLICLRKGHMANKCRQFVKCMCCGKRHFIIMCPVVHNKVNEKPTQNVLLCSRNHTTTLLQTLIIYVSYKGRGKKVRVLLDSGSQRSYVKAAVVKELGLQQTGTETIGHSLFGGVKQDAKRYRCFELEVSDLKNSFSCSINVLEQKNICGHLPKIKNDQLVDKLRDMNIEISDYNYEDTEISLLIGSDFLPSLITNELVKLSNNLIAVRTNLGWTLQGPTTTSNTSTNTVSLTCFSQDNLSDLWSLELLGIKDPFEKQSKIEMENEVLKSFNKNVSVNERNRYEVSLLWKEGCPKLCTNYEMASKRLQHLTKKLKTTGNLEAYNQVLQDWKKNEIIEEVTNDNIEVGHYIPHHCVLKTSSATTKVRPVFDASAKDKNGWSLNGCLKKGINMIELLPKLLILFRKGTYGVISDIKQAFLQISLKEEDREYLKFLWWNNIDKCEKLVAYKHKRVVFGVTCSPFLLSATINYHLRKYEQKYKETVKKLKDSFYVDNCVTSCETLNELNTFITEAKMIMGEGMFDLRGWITAPHRCDDTHETAVLGMIWNTLEDNLRCNVSIKISEKITKRYVISVAQHVFDPLGFVCPATLLPKLVMQKIWNQKIDWDQEVPSAEKQEFLTWLKSAHLINKCQIPRRISDLPIKDCKSSLHIFSDACKTSYAACVFLRTQNKGKVHVRLVLAKNRVAPNKNQMSLPRLELMSALIATRLYKEVLESELLENCEYKVYFYTDSSVVLAWIQRQTQWKTFVSNRVQEICMTTNRSDWYHIPGELNPADLPSRGCSAKKLLETRWFDGPLWLKREEDQWPKSSNLRVNEEEVQKEIKQDTITNMEVLITEVFSHRLMYFSKYNQIVRLVAWILRWRNKVKGKRNVRANITNDEYEDAQNCLIKLLQRENFTLEKLPKSINTKVDDKGFIRVRTRLELSQQDEKFVSPILLPGKNEIVRRLVMQRHEKLNHAGTQFLLSNLRNDFWILNIRCLTKSVVSRCIVCKRHKSKHYEVREAPLPANRIEATSAFQVTGIDLAGPLYIRDQSKCWIVLFTCATYRAVHLELVESLSTSAFMMSLRRFIARRGRVSVIYTDCGSNFQGAANLLKMVDWAEIEAATAVVPPIIKWRFSPPKAPWWGGWWERLIKVVKDILKRMLGKQTLSLVELNTLLCDCEAVINNRPLTYVSTSDNFVKPLAPIMFLNPLTSTDTPDLDQIDANNLNLRLRYLNKIRHDFKQRFRNEYLGLICSKNRCKEYLPRVNDVVLIENEFSRLYWPLGIIKDLITGTDGSTRVAKVQTASGELKRAVQRLYPLELTTVGDEWCRRTDGKVVDDGPGDAVLDAIPDLDLPDRNQSSRTRHGRVIKLPQRFLD